MKQAWKDAGMHFHLFPNVSVRTFLILLFLECLYIKMKILLQKDTLIYADHTAKGQASFRLKIKFPVYML